MVVTTRGDEAEAGRKRGLGNALFGYQPTSSGPCTNGADSMGLCTIDLRSVSSSSQSDYSPKIHNCLSFAQNCAVVYCLEKYVGNGQATVTASRGIKWIKRTRGTAKRSWIGCTKRFYSVRVWSIATLRTCAYLRAEATAASGFLSRRATTSYVPLP